MEFSAEQRGRATIVALEGSIDALTADDVTGYLEGQIKGDNNRLVVDLSRVEYISSAGLRSLLTTLKSARQAGGDLRLAGAQENVWRVLSMAGFASIIKTYPDVEQALAGFA